MRLRIRWSRIKELLIGPLAAMPAVVCVAIATFVFAQALPFFSQYNLAHFFSSEWLPSRHRFGVLPMIVGSAYVTLGATLFAVPIGLGAGIFISEIAPSRIGELLRVAVLLLAAVPPIVYGFFGLVVLVPRIRELFGGSGFSVLAASIVLAVMILPTVTAGTASAVRSVRTEYREGALALGATQWQIIFTLLLYVARPGIGAGIVLGIARSIGETMIVLMVTGNVVQYPTSPIDPVRTLTGNIALETAYAAGEHRQALFATALVLFAFIGTTTLAVHALFRKGQQFL